jgi:MraZ protein
VDKNGRFCIPEDMAKAVGIDGEATFVGLVDRFEIWNPERYAAVKSNDELSSADAFKLIS